MHVFLQYPVVSWQQKAWVFRVLILISLIPSRLVALQKPSLTPLQRDKSSINAAKSTEMDVFFLMRKLSNQFTRPLLILCWTTRTWLILGLLEAQQRADPW